MNEEKTPWFREPYVWLLIAFPLSAIVGGIITISLAIDSDDGLVVDDYYKKGLEINRVLERDKTAAELGLETKLQFSEDKSRLRLFLSGNEKFKLPEQLRISFLHSTRAGFDQYITVKKSETNIYIAKFPPLTAGSWYIQMETENWRLLESITIH